MSTTAPQQGTGTPLLALTDVSATLAQLPVADAETYAGWFACLAEPTRVRLLHAVAVAGRAIAVGELAEQLGISQSTCSHHLRKLADVDLDVLERLVALSWDSMNALYPE